MRVRTDVAALPRLFDYAVPEAWPPFQTDVGARVRVELHGRRVGAWVVEREVQPPEGITPFPLRHWSGWGPPAPVVDLAGWAAWRWAGPVSFFLGAASPERPVRALPAAPARRRAFPDDRDAAPADSPAGLLAAHAAQLRSGGVTLLRLPPTTDLLDVVRAVVDAPSVAGRPGAVLVLVPSLGWAERLCARLVRRGYAATTDWAEARAGWPVVVGTRRGAWSPLPDLAAAVVLDAHDEAYREESAPTYSAVDVALERARRAGSPCIVTSPCPPLVVRAACDAENALTGAAERAGWPTMEVVDRRGADPRTGMFSEEFVRLAHAVRSSGEAPLVCFYDRTGRARLLACTHCGEVARCTTCGAAVQQKGEGLGCPRCGTDRPMVCASCGRLRMKTLRAGVARLREELTALLGSEVGEVSGPGGAEGEGVPDASVLVGTEAVLHRVRHAAAVAFLDVDLHLLAPRFSAADETCALFVRAARLLGPRRAGAPWSRVLVQTRVPDDPVLMAIQSGEPATLVEGEERVRRGAHLPPYVALATISGTLAEAYVSEVRTAVTSGTHAAGVSVTTLPDGRFLVQAPDHDILCALLDAVPRPPGRGLRVAVDPVAV